MVGKDGAASAWIFVNFSSIPYLSIRQICSTVFRVLIFVWLNRLDQFEIAGLVESIALSTDGPASLLVPAQAQALGCQVVPIDELAEEERTEVSFTHCERCGRPRSETVLSWVTVQELTRTEHFRFCQICTEQLWQFLQPIGKNPDD